MPQHEFPVNILVLGATGFIGGRLVSRLAEAGHAVRVMARSAAKAGAKGWTGVEITEGDVLERTNLDRSCSGIQAVYYLVHSMSAGEGDFETRDRTAAANVAGAAGRR